MKAKRLQVRLPAEEESVFKERISLDRLGQIWNDDETQYSQEELSKIRNWLYSITELIFETSKIAEQKCIELKPNNDEETQSDFICEGQYRRAS